MTQKHICPQCKSEQYLHNFEDDSAICTTCQLYIKLNMNTHPKPDFLDEIKSKLELRTKKQNEQERRNNIQREFEILKNKSSNFQVEKISQPVVEKVKYFYCRRVGCSTKLRTPNYYGVCSYCQAKSGMYRKS